MTPRNTEPSVIRRLLLLCGIVASLLYVAMLFLAPLRWDGYSSASQTVSELVAINAPTRSFVVPLMVTYSTSSEP